MSLDNFNLTIEQMAVKNGGSYIEALKEFAEVNKVVEFEDLTEKLHPILLEKVKAEFIRKKFFPSKKVENSLEGFF